MTLLQCRKIGILLNNLLDLLLYFTELGLFAIHTNANRWGFPLPCLCIYETSLVQPTNTQCAKTGKGSLVT